MARRVAPRVALPRRAATIAVNAADTAHEALARKLAGLLARNDPAMLARLTEIGVVRPGWERDDRSPLADSSAFDVLERSMESLVERRPSTLAHLGLSAVSVLSSTLSAADADGGLRTAAVLFTDLEGFTSYTARVGDEVATALLQEHYAVAGRTVRRRGGRVVKRLGDGLMMTFPESAAAVLAALELVALPPRSQQGPAQRLRVRAGVHVGEFVTAGHDALGHVVNVAARVTDAAGGGEVLVTAQVREQLREVEDLVRIGRVRKVRLKGVGGRTELHRVFNR